MERRFRNAVTCFLLMLTLCLLFTCNMWAQGGTGELSGVVTLNGAQVGPSVMGGVRGRLHFADEFGSEAASALGETQLKESPGGSIRPFCEPATVTSTPHSSCR